MKYNDVSFNAEWASSITEEAFIAHEKHHGLTKAQLSEAYLLMKKAKGNEDKLGKLIDKTESKADIAAQPVPVAAEATAQAVVKDMPGLNPGDTLPAPTAISAPSKAATSGNDQSKVNKVAGLQPKGSSGNSAKGNK